MKERRLLPTPINQPIATAEPQPRHSRFSIFNRVTNQMQQSVIKLNPAKPVPTSVRRLNFTTELSPVKVQPTVRDDDETGDTVETVKTQLTKKLSRPSVICPNPAVPNIMDIEHDESNSDDDAEIDLNQLKRTFHAVKNAFYNHDITTKRPRISHIESKTYSIPKKLQVFFSGQFVPFLILISRLSTIPRAYSPFKPHSRHLALGARQNACWIWSVPRIHLSMTRLKSKWRFDARSRSQLAAHQRPLLA